MNTNQYKRYLKSTTEKIYLLDIYSTTNNEITCKISGSTQNVYTVIIKNMTIKCDCPDMEGWSKIQHCICKHCCFVLFKVLKIYTCGATSSSISKNFKDFHKNKFIFSSEDLSVIEYATKNIELTRTNDYYRPSISSKYKELCNKTIPKPIDDDDTCVICFDNLNDGEIVTCGTCKNHIHADCMKKWLSSNNSCVYCRSSWNPQTYLNINNVIVEEESILTNKKNLLISRISNLDDPNMIDILLRVLNI